MAFLFLKLENRDENSRVGTINVLKHLVNAAGTCTAPMSCAFALPLPLDDITIA